MVAKILVPMTADWHKHHGEQEELEFGIVLEAAAAAPAPLLIVVESGAERGVIEMPSALDDILLRSPIVKGFCTKADGQKVLWP